VKIRVFGQHRSVTDGGGSWRWVVDGLGGGGQHGRTQVVVAVDERSVHPGSHGCGCDRDFRSVTVHVGDGFVHSRSAAPDIAAPGCDERRVSGLHR
jgi:hypothetical protein